LVVAVGLEARRRRAGEEGIFGRRDRGDGRAKYLDLARERGLPAIDDRRRADPERPRRPDLGAGRVKQRATLAGVTIKVGELLAVLALQQHRLAALRRPL